MAIEVGNIFEGRVTGVKPFGAFVALPEGRVGMVHISEVSNEFVHRRIFPKLKPLDSF